MKTDPNIPLQISPELDFHLQSNGDLDVTIAGQRYRCGRHGLAILNLFRQPHSMREANAKLGSELAGKQDWVELSSTLYRMAEQGVLIDHTASQQSRPKAGYADALIHTQMLNDRARTDAYIKAIRSQVRPDDVVVDLGTGTGVLAIAAAQAGARHVYAIEASEIGATAREMFAANGVEDRITLVEGWSTEVSLPQRADLFISEMIGNDPFGEQLFEITVDARERFLNANARLIPSAITAKALVLDIPQEELNLRTFTAHNFEHWQQWYGIDFDALDRFNPSLEQLYFRNPKQAASWPTLAPPITLTTLDMATCDRLPALEANFNAERDGAINAVLLYFELEMAPGATFSVEPRQCDPANHWICPIWLLPQAVQVERGARMRLTNTRESVSNLGEMRVSKSD